MARELELDVEMLATPKKKGRAKAKAKGRSRPRPTKGSILENEEGAPRRRRKKGRPNPNELVGKKKLCAPVDICGQRYRVLVDTDYSNTKLEGACTWADNLIEILGQAEDRMHDALIHELLHALMDACGFKWSVAKTFPKMTLKERTLLDEMVCRLVAPALLSTLRGAGWLRLPRWTRHRNSQHG